MATAKTSLVTILFLSLMVYIGLGYYTERTNFSQLILLYSLAFILYGVSVYLVKLAGIFSFTVAAAVLFRLALLFYLPNLSDDFYRFVWDGQISIQGVNVFHYLPSELIENSSIAVDVSVFEMLNSPDYYSVYPPVNQLVFIISCLLASNSILKSVVIMKMFIVLFEIGSMYLLYKLLHHFQLKKELIFLYVLNPLIIVELTGNIHFEASMIFFTLLAAYLVIKGKIILSGIAMACAVATKLWPLLFLPFFIKRFNLKNTLIFSSATFITIFLLYLPYYTTGFAEKYGSGLALYFNIFEFNGIIYYLVKKAGYAFSGQNIMDAAGMWFPVIVVVLSIIVFLADQTKNWQSLFLPMLITLTIYFLFATTVHPWYITPLIAFSIFTPFKYPLLWSALIPMTYITYRTIPYLENEWVVLMEYLVLAVFIIMEIAKNRKREWKPGLNIRYE